MHKEANPDNYVVDELDISSFLLRLVKILQRNLKIFSFILLIGILSGALYYKISRPVYLTKLIASSKILTNVRVENLIQVLNNLAEESNTDQLSKKMHISPFLASSIKQLESKGILSERPASNKSTEIDTNVFEITLLTFYNQHLDSLQMGILYYLQHNDFVEKRTAIQKQNLEIMLSRVREEVNKLDSLRFSVNRILNKGIGSNSTMLMSDPASVNKDIMALYERELDIKAELQLIDDIQVIQDFTQFNKPTSPKLLKAMAASTSTAVFVALLIIVILEILRKVKKVKLQEDEKSV